MMALYIGKAGLTTQRANYGGDDMIEDLFARRTYWNRPENRAPRDDHDLVDSLPYPFEGFEHLFVDKGVLEIGPGRGRQYARLRGRTCTYSLCDISPAALAERVFDDATAKYVLDDYGDDFVERFDVIHFWYVLHHVRTTELGDFFGFVARHLHAGGTALFNTPQSGNAREWYADNGLGTTWMDHTLVTTAISPHLTIRREIILDDRSSGILFIADRK